MNSTLRFRLLLLPLLLLLAFGTATAQRKTLSTSDLSFKGLHIGMTEEELRVWHEERASFLKVECKERKADGRNDEAVFEGAEYCNFTFIFEQKQLPEALQFRRVATTADGNTDANLFILFSYLYEGKVFGITAGTPDETDQSKYVEQLSALYDAMRERYGTPTSGAKNPAAAATQAKRNTEKRVDLAIWQFSAGGHNYEIKLQARHHSGSKYEAWIGYDDLTTLAKAFGTDPSSSGSSSGSRSNF